MFLVPGALALVPPLSYVNYHPSWITQCVSSLVNLARVGFLGVQSRRALTNSNGRVEGGGSEREIRLRERLPWA